MDFIVNYWVEFLFGTLISFVMYLFKKVNQHYKLMISTRNGVQALLKAKIIEIYNQYEDAGSMSLHTKEMIDELYTQYKNLGGNGVIEKIVDNIEEIPISKCQ